MKLNFRTAYTTRCRAAGLLLVTAVMFGLSACKKEVEAALPGGTADAALNFYAATDVMAAAYGPGRGTVAVYVDQYRESSGPVRSSPGNPFPTFSFTGNVPQSPDTRADNSIYYSRYTAGSHRLYFTDINNTTVLDTVIGPGAGSFSSLYLADVPAPSGAPAAYKLVTAQEPRQVPEGKTGVRFIQLSPDAGTLTAGLQKADGSLVAAQTGSLAFGQVSEYQYFDQSDVVNGLLRFTLQNAAGANLTTGTPFGAGRSYVVVIAGFAGQQQRRVATGKNTDGSVKTETITIASNLRTDVRRSY